MSRVNNVMGSGRYYIAYGSNLNIGQMEHRCPTAVPIGTAWLEGYELNFKGSKTGSYLTVDEKEGGRVPVAIWEIQPQDERCLDRYEGFPQFYYKKDFVLAVKSLDGSTVRNLNCFVYLMSVDRQIGITSTVYLNTCLEGYTDFGFDTKYLMDACDRAYYHCAKSARTDIDAYSFSRLNADLWALHDKFKSLQKLYGADFYKRGIKAYSYGSTYRSYSAYDADDVGGRVSRTRKTGGKAKRTAPQSQNSGTRTIRVYSNVLGKYVDYVVQKRG